MNQQCPPVLFRFRMLCSFCSRGCQTTQSCAGRCKMSALSCKLKLEQHHQRCRKIRRIQPAPLHLLAQLQQPLTALCLAAQMQQTNSIAQAKRAAATLATAAASPQFAVMHVQLQWLISRRHVSRNSLLLAARLPLVAATARSAPAAQQLWRHAAATAAMPKVWPSHVQFAVRLWTQGQSFVGPAAR